MYVYKLSEWYYKVNTMLILVVQFLLFSNLLTFKLKKKWYTNYSIETGKKNQITCILKVILKYTI